MYRLREKESPPIRGDEWYWRSRASRSADRKMPRVFQRETGKEQLVRPSTPSAGPQRNGSAPAPLPFPLAEDRKSTRLNSRHGYISHAVFCLKKQISTR